MQITETGIENVKDLYKAIQHSDNSSRKHDSDND